MYWSVVLALLLVVFKIVLYLLRKLKVGNNCCRYVLVTGCDSGFGNLLTKQLDILGFHVFAGCLTAESVAALKSECSDNVVAIQMDVSNSESIKNSVDRIKDKLPHQKGLWAIVNNAGIIGSIGPTSWQTKDDYEQVMSVNLYGVIMVTKECLPLVLKERGRVINTASIMGRFAFSTPSYCISKYGVEAFSDVLRRENYRSGLSVHIIEPGFYRTPLVDRDSFRKRVEHKIKHLPQEVENTLPDNFVDQMTKEFDLFLGKVASPNVNDVVEAYIHAITSKFPKYRYLVGFDANYIFRPLWMLPEWISDWMINKMMNT